MTTRLGRCIGSWPSYRRSCGNAGLPQPLVVTTNYDRALERAYSDADEAADVVSYVSLGRDRGKFLHRSADGDTRVIATPNVYADVPLDRRPVLLKIHGEVDLEPARDAESFVISEDDYIGYLTESGLGGVLPVTVAARLRRSHFLFLGYGLVDWSFRVFLQRLWPDEQPAYRSWAIQPAATPLERDFWRRRGLELVDAALDEQLERLRGRLLLARSGGGAVSSASTLSVSPSPYKGLAPFDDTELDALLFFGRGRETEIVAANVLASRLTVLYGPSGVGKSSLLRAGVVRSLRREGGLPPPAVAVYGSWGGDPLAGLDEAARAAVAEALGHEPTDAPGELPDRLAAWTAELGAELCLLLDQLEELFLYHPAAGGAGGFVDLLPDLVMRPGLRVNVLLGIRDDALAQLDVFKGRIPGLFANSLRLDHLDREAARAAILGPLDRLQRARPDGPCGRSTRSSWSQFSTRSQTGRIEPALMGRGTVESEGGRSGLVETPYLQLVMQRVWEVERERGSRLLRLETFRGLGGAQRIVEDHLGRALQALTPAEQRRGGKRLRAPRDSVRDEGRPRRRRSGELRSDGRGRPRARAALAGARADPSPAWRERPCRGWPLRDLSRRARRRRARLAGGARHAAAARSGAA